jgi:hypothetical protein
MAADVEEGANVAKPVLEAGEVSLMQPKVSNLQTRPEATFSLRFDGDPSRNFTPVVAARCPMVGANCHGILRTVAIGMA